MGVPIRLVLALEVVVEVGGPPATGGALQTTIDYIIGSKRKAQILFNMPIIFISLRRVSTTGQASP